MRRSIVATASLTGEDPALVAEALALARGWTKDRSVVDPDMVQTVLSVAARNADSELFELLVVEARQTKSASERRGILWALGGARQPDLAKLALGLLLSGDIDPREAANVLWGASAYADTQDTTWAFVKANFDTLVARLPRDFPAFFPILFRRFGDDEHRVEVESFFRDRAAKYAGGPLQLAQSLEQIQLQIAFRKAQETSLRQFLEAYPGVRSVRSDH